MVPAGDRRRVASGTPGEVTRTLEYSLLQEGLKSLTAGDGLVCKKNSYPFRLCQYT